MAVKRYLVSLDLSRNEIRNVVLQNLSSAPSSPTEGQIYYDSTAKVDYIFNGTIWVDRSRPTGSAGGDLTGTYPSPTVGAGVITDAKIAINAAIQLSKLATDPLARGNHTGTQLAATISNFDTQVRASRLDQMAAPITSVSMNSQKITNVLDPTNPQDVATKAYVDAVATGLDVKASVRAATTANLTLSGTQTVDGVALVAGDRVLVKDQTAGSTNGIYVVATGAWTRATDADSNGEVTPGMFTFVEEGATNNSTGWLLSTNAAITLGTTALTFVQFSSAGTITAGNGLTKTGNSLDVVGTAGRISVAADSVDIDAGYVGQTSITTLGTVATGAWNATPIGLTKGGTGATTAAGARTAIGAPGKYTQTLTRGATTEDVTHNLGTQDVTVAVREISTNDQVDVGVSCPSANTISLTFGSTIAAASYVVTIIG